MRRVLRVWSGLLCLLFSVSMCLGVTLAWKSLNQSARNDIRRVQTVTLVKYEKNAEGEPTETRVPGAVFRLFAEGDEGDRQIGGTYTTNAEGKISLHLNLPAGKYYFEEVSPPPGYTFDEIRTPGGVTYRSTRYPFEVKEVKDGGGPVTVPAYNRRLTGSLTIEKQVEHYDDPEGALLTTAEKEQRFTFKVEFSDGGTYSCTIDGTPYTVASGKTIQLHHGQKAVFSDLPVGVQYTVTEVSVPSDYDISSVNNQGHITETGQAAWFTNILDQPEVTGPAKLVVTKALAGEYPAADMDKEFTFTLYLNGTAKETFRLKNEGRKEFEVEPGTVYQVVEEDCFRDGYSQSSVNAFGTIHEEQTNVVFTNLWADQPQVNIMGEKTWEVPDESLIPESITVNLYGDGLLVGEGGQVVRPDEHGRWHYSFSAPKYNAAGEEIHYTVREEPIDNFAPHYEEDGYDIRNVYVEPLEIDPPIGIEKVVLGSGAPTTEFKFILHPEDGAPLPDPGRSDGKREGENMSYTLNGAGKVAELGWFTFTHPGDYVYTVYEASKGESGWIYDTIRYTLTFRVAEKAGEPGKLEVERTLVKNERGEDSALIFHNTYDSSLPPPSHSGGGSGGGDDDDDDDKEILLSGEKRWNHDGNPSETRPDSVVVCVYANGEVVHRRQVTAKDDWRYSFTLPKYDKKGQKIVYTVGEEPVPGYACEVQGWDLVNTYVGMTPTPTVSPTVSPSGSPGPGTSMPPTESGSPTPVTTATAPASPTPTPPDVVKTGDSNELGLWTTVTVLGAVGTLGCLVYLFCFNRRRQYAGKHLRKR